MGNQLKSRIDGYIVRLQKIQQDSTLDEGGKGLDDLLDLADLIRGDATDALYRGNSPSPRITDAETTRRWVELAEGMKVLERAADVTLKKLEERR